MQQLPRGAHRRCVRPQPVRVLEWTDYNQVELRLAAKISGDPALTAAFRRGDDLHVQTARLVLVVAEPTPEARQLAKALNFGLLYGMGAEGVQRYAQSQHGVTLSLEEATSYRDTFFRTYPGLAPPGASITLD